MKKICIIIGIVILCVMLLPGSDNFTLVEQWTHEFEPLGSAIFSLADADGDIIVSFQQCSNRLISREKVITFAPMGEGPNDLTNTFGMCRLKDKDIAIVERAEKIKIFTKKDGTYVWKETVWLKRGEFIHATCNVLFYDNKWILPGYEELRHDKDKNPTAAWLKIYDAKGQPLKSLIEKFYDFPNMHLNIRSYALPHRDQVLFLAENELKVTAVSLKDLKIVQPIDLATPNFYKKMPADFYGWEKYDKPGENYFLDFQKWQTGYSRITRALIAGEFLVLQIRTCSTPEEKLKKHALLFYNLRDYKLEKTIDTDDLLLAYQDGKYYFFANGDPGLDEEAEDFKINIYSFSQPAGNTNSKKQR